MSAQKPWLVPTDPAVAKLAAMVDGTPEPEMPAGEAEAARKPPVVAKKKGKRAAPDAPTAPVLTRVSFYVNPAEHWKIRQAAAANFSSVNDYIRAVLLEE